MSIVADLVTVDEYATLPADGTLTELIKGRIVEMSRPTPRHGEICTNIIFLFGGFVREHGLGRTVTNDAGIIIERDPDTLRGADVAYYSYETIPQGPLPAGFLTAVPDIAFEVNSEHDRWSEIIAKAGELLQAGVERVCVLDPDRQEIHVFSSDAPVRVLGPDNYLEFPDLVANFRALVRRFFD